MLKVSPKVGKEEQEAREQLALCYRVCHQEVLCEGVDNHLSVMLYVDGHEALLTLPHGILWSTCKPEDFILVDMDGQILRPSARAEKPSFGREFWVPDLSAIMIHCQLHRGLGDKRAKAVFHTHQPYTSDLAAMKPPQDEVKMVHQNSARFKDSVIYYRDFNGIVNNKDEGLALCDQFQKKGNETKRVILLRNHGIITIGKSIADAMMDLYFFEKAAMTQIELMKIKQPCQVIEDEIADGVHEYWMTEQSRLANSLLNAWHNAGV